MSKEPFQCTQQPNGLRIVTERQPEHKGKAAFLTMVEGGWRCHSPKHAGLAHLLEHLIMRGDKPLVRRNQSILDTYIQAGYTIVSGQATTGSIYSAYNSDTNSSTMSLKKDFKRFFFYVNRAVADPGFTRDLFIREQNIVLAEFDHTKAPMLTVQSDKAIYNFYHFPEVHQETLGTKKIVGRLAPEDIHAFHQSFYTPERVVIGATGDVNHDQICAWSEQIWGNRPSGTKPPLSRATLVPGVHDVPLKASPAVELFIHFADYAQKRGADNPYPMFLRLMIGEHIYKKMRRMDDLVYHVYVGLNPPSHARSYFITYKSDVPKIPATLKSLSQALESFPQNLTEKNIAAFRKGLEIATRLSTATPDTRASTHAFNLAQGLPVLTTESFLSTLHSLTPDRMLAAYHDMISSPASILVLRPTSAEAALSPIRAFPSQLSQIAAKIFDR
jgi:predicted Zn-dependent peptidase